MYGNGQQGNGQVNPLLWQIQQIHNERQRLLEQIQQIHNERQWLLTQYQQLQQQNMTDQVRFQMQQTQVRDAYLIGESVRLNYILQQQMFYIQAQYAALVQQRYQMQQPQQEQTLQQEDNINQQLPAENLTAQSDIPQQPLSQRQADVVESQTIEAKPELQQVNTTTIDELTDDKNALPVKSAAERIRELPVYAKLEDLQEKIKEIFGDCTITVGRKQQSVSDYFDRFKPGTSSVVFWSNCKLAPNINSANAVAVKVAQKLRSTTLSMTRDSKNDGIKLCDYAFRGGMIVNTEFDVESSFLAAQEFNIAYFVSNENVAVGGVWTNFELPILLRNPSVKQIIRVDARVYFDIKDLTDTREIMNAVKLSSRTIFDRQQHPDFGNTNRLCHQILDIKSVSNDKGDEFVDPGRELY